MCGIVALFRTDGAPTREDEIVAMRDMLIHRGPDDAGIFVEGPVALGHRRLKIIDLDGGRQPMANSRGTVHVVFNGEIYDYQELRSRLMAAGVHLRTQSDTETILGLYDLYGDDLVSHLRGMFAFVLWDGARHRLLAARDRLGIKPLYVAREGHRIAFASEIKALVSSCSSPPGLAEDTVAEYLAFRHLTGTRTMFRGIESIAPGETLAVTADGETRRRYWALPVPTSSDASTRPTADWGDELDSLLDQIVGQHMLSDVPLGTFNSGGVDSSLITAYVARRAGPRLNTYSFGFEDPAFDERPFANVVAERFETRHHSVVMPERQYAEWLPRAIWHHDEPLNHPHSIHLAYLSRKARERVTVVLTGEGSDELFAGYPRYRLPYLLDRASWLGLRLKPALRFAARCAPGRARLRIEQVLHPQGGFRLDALAAFVAVGELHEVLIPPLGRDILARVGEVVASPPDLLSRALGFDQQTYLQSLLCRLDKMSMAAGLEGRVPFLDHHLVEFAAQVPPGLKIRRLENKWLVKQVARRYLPERIVDRRKAGFAIPIADWLRKGGALATFLDVLLEPRSLSRGYLHPPQVRRIAEAHRSGRSNHAELLWGLINLELWHRVMIDERGARPVGGPADVPPTAPTSAASP